MNYGYIVLKIIMVSEKSIYRVYAVWFHSEVQG